MGNLLYIVAALLLISWAIGFFVYSIGSIIHILFVVAVVAVIVSVVRNSKLLK